MLGLLPGYNSFDVKKLRYQFYVSFRLHVKEIRFKRNDYFLRDSRYTIFQKSGIFRKSKLKSHETITEINQLARLSVEERLKVYAYVRQSIQGKYINKYKPVYRKVVIRQVTRISEYDDVYRNIGYIELPCHELIKVKEPTEFIFPIMDDDGGVEATVKVIIERKLKNNPYDGSLSYRAGKYIATSIYNFCFPQIIEEVPSRLEVNQEFFEMLRDRDHSEYREIILLEEHEKELRRNYENRKAAEKKRKQEEEKTRIANGGGANSPTASAASPSKRGMHRPIDEDDDLQILQFSEDDFDVIESPPKTSLTAFSALATANRTSTVETAVSTPNSPATLQTTSRRQNPATSAAPSSVPNGSSTAPQKSRNSRTEAGGLQASSSSSNDWQNSETKPTVRSGNSSLHQQMRQQFNQSQQHQQLARTSDEELRATDSVDSHDSEPTIVRQGPQRRMSERHSIANGHTPTQTASQQALLGESPDLTQQSRSHDSRNFDLQYDQVYNNAHHSSDGLLQTPQQQTTVSGYSPTTYFTNEYQQQTRGESKSQSRRSSQFAAQYQQQFLETTPPPAMPPNTSTRSGSTQNFRTTPNSVSSSALPSSANTAQHHYEVVREPTQQTSQAQQRTPSFTAPRVPSHSNVYSNTGVSDHDSTMPPPPYSYPTHQAPSQQQQQQPVVPRKKGRIAESTAPPPPPSGLYNPATGGTNGYNVNGQSQQQRPSSTRSMQSMYSQQPPNVQSQTPTQQLYNRNSFDNNSNNINSNVNGYPHPNEVSPRTSFVGSPGHDSASSTRRSLSLSRPNSSSFYGQQYISALEAQQQQQQVQSPSPSGYHYGQTPPPPQQYMSQPQPQYQQQYQQQPVVRKKVKRIGESDGPAVSTGYSSSSSQGSSHYRAQQQYQSQPQTVYRTGSGGRLGSANGGNGNSNYTSPPAYTVNYQPYQSPPPASPHSSYHQQYNYSNDVPPSASYDSESSGAFDEYKTPSLHSRGGSRGGNSLRRPNSEHSDQSWQNLPPLQTLATVNSGRPRVVAQMPPASSSPTPDHDMEQDAYENGDYDRPARPAQYYAPPVHYASDYSNSRYR